MVHKGRIKRYDKKTGNGLITTWARGTDARILNMPGKSWAKDQLVWFMFYTHKDSVRRVAERIETYDFSDDFNDN